MISQEAADYLEKVAEDYLAAGRPNHRTWFFDAGHDGERDSIHDELVGLQFIKFAGMRGAGFFLTDLGLEWAKANTRAFRPKRSRGASRSSIEQRQSDRLLFLMTLFDLADGTELDVESDELQSETGLQDAAFEAAEEYLLGEHLVDREVGSLIHLTHRGVLECEAAFGAAERHEAGDGTEHFKQAVVQNIINNHFHSAVASVQTGSGTIGNVRQTVTYSSAIPSSLRDELAALFTEMRRQAETESLAEEDRAEALSALHNVETQLAKPKPIAERINTYLAIFASLVTVAGANVERLQQLLPHILAALGVQ